MASNRKLQGEIDRVLKQIGEHMQEFDQIWYVCRAEAEESAWCSTRSERRRASGALVFRPRDASAR